MKKYFLTLADGTPVASVKKQAKKAHKNKNFESLSLAQNSITRSLVNKSFNKATEEAKSISPFILPKSDTSCFQNDVDALFIPILIKSKENNTCSAWGENKSTSMDEFYYYVSVTSTHIHLDANTSIELESQLDVNSIKLKDVSKMFGHTRSGWRILLGDTAIEVRHSEELGIIADIWSVENSELSEVINSAYIATTGLVSDSHIYTNKSVEFYTDYELAMELECDNPDDRNYIFSAGGLDLVLSSCITTADSEGNKFHGYNIIYSALSETYETEEELKSLKKSLTHGFMVDSLHCLTNGLLMATPGLVLIMKMASTHPRLSERSLLIFKIGC